MIVYEKLQKRLRVKYGAERFVALVLLLPAAPLFLLIAVMIWVDGLLHPENRGGVFYREPRLSADRVFYILKFRTVTRKTIAGIRERPDSRSITGYPETTRAGKWILKWYMDELPQLINILWGEMVFVGPRPHIRDQYDEGIRQGCLYRKYLKAGLLGIPQACKKHPNYKDLFERMAKSHKSNIESLNTLDGLYAKKCLEYPLWRIILFDLMIIFRCGLVVLRGFKD